MMTVLQSSSEQAPRQPGAVSLARVLYGLHAAIVAALALLVIFGRSRDFPVVIVLFPLGVILSIVLFVLTFFRRRGFSYRRTLPLFAAAPVAAAIAFAAHGPWVESRWPGNRQCLQRLAESLVTTFNDVGDSAGTLEASSESDDVHGQFASQLRSCGMMAVTIKREQIEFWSDELGIPTDPGGYVFRSRGRPELVYCPYILTGRDDKPPRVLEPRWYYCHA